MSGWNRIGDKDRYKITLVDTLEKWEEKKREITEVRKQTILREGSVPSSFGNKIKYWAEVSVVKKG